MNTDPILPPNNRDAEAAVLGSCLIDPTAIYLIADRLKPEMFYTGKYRLIYQAILGLYSANKPVDMLTVADQLRAGELQIDDADIEVASLITADIPTSANVEHYAEIVVETAMLRDVIKLASTTAKAAYEEQQIGDVVSAASAGLFEITNGSMSGTETAVSKLVANVIDRAEELNNQNQEIVGVPTGLTDLDRLIGGLQGPDLLLLAARPGMGKTSLSNGAALNAIRNGYRVGMFMLEMSGEQTIQRLMSHMSGIPITHIRRPVKMHDDEWPKFHEAAGELAKYDHLLRIDDTPGVTPMHVRTKCHKWRMEHGLDLVIIDYLQLMTPDGKEQNQNYAMASISKTLKKMAREFDVPVLALAQLSRGVESRQEKKPMLSDLRDSGSLEQDADIVMFIYREDYYNGESAEKPGVAEVNIAKHRNGPTAQVDLYWNAERAMFANLERQPIDLNGYHAARPLGGGLEPTRGLMDL